ncbi:hypothetical protein F0L74_07655 [Chitinophaga agrisoli]|uniref:N-acetyltransferase domain-containing protein n=1 Tax=Chitinophaga agrisoli TaxID=2607653 RepID=A0A5B2VRP2_9BACT|nr:hypothetical protein [Chitinophaga agrisoli]KAA2242413.1 hypothetical protein F0L74_07655 [Chitinophaga agrisoli]
MFLHEYVTGKCHPAIIELMTKKDFDVVKRDKGRFKFDWHKYKLQICEVYKLQLKRTNIILGLICLTEHCKETADAIEISLIEVSAENRGKGKQYGNIAGCLIAFACQQSIEKDHGGYVLLAPKTRLLKHYQTAYGPLYTYQNRRKATRYHVPGWRRGRPSD